MKAKSGFYELKVESISKFSAIFLDMTVSKNRRWHDGGVMDISSFTKPTNQKVPLRDSSAHHVQVHTAWPIQRFLHFDRLCTTYAGALEAKARFIAEFIAKTSGHAAIPSLIENLIGRPSRVDKRAAGTCSWMVVPFHLAYEGAQFGKIIASFESSWPQRFAYLFPRLAWKLVEPNIACQMQRHLEHVLTDQPTT